MTKWDGEKWVDKRVGVAMTEGRAVFLRGKREACYELLPLVEAARAVNETRTALQNIRKRIATEGTIGTLVSAEGDLEYVLEDKLDAQRQALRDLGVLDRPIENHRSGGGEGCEECGGTGEAVNIAHDGTIAMPSTWPRCPSCTQRKEKP